MRKHLYRGFKPDQNGTTEITLNGEKIKGKWIEGYYVHTYDSHKIFLPQGTDVDGFEYYHVLPETVGEYTGLPDMNGTKIFEGDIVRLTPPKESRKIYASTAYDPKEDRILSVVFFDGMFAVDMRKWWKYGHGRVALQSYELDRIEVLGNIYENPELLK